MPMVLELCDEDLEVMLRVHRQRQLRELDLREPNPEISAASGHCAFALPGSRVDSTGPVSAINRCHLRPLRETARSAGRNSTSPGLESSLSTARRSLMPKNTLTS